MKTSTNIFRSSFRMIFLLTSVATCLTIGFFGGESRLAAQVPVIKSIQSRPPGIVGISNKDMQNICIAAISTLFNQPTSAITVGRVEKGMMHLSHTMRADSFQEYTCKIEGQKVLLAKLNGAGRAESEATFHLTTDEILITAFTDGLERKHKFPR